MRYLFFDIECANSYKGDPKMCEFGYVITDADFNLIRKEDIPMSPGRGRGCGFDLYIRKVDPAFDWAYDISYYYSCPEFYEYYELIAGLLTSPETMVFGYSVHNDVAYLDAAIDRYGLGRFDYRVHDIQRLAAFLLKSKKGLSLEEAFQTLCGKQELIHLQPHLSRDDAYMSMRILSALCMRENASPAELFSRLQSASFSALESLQKQHQKKQRLLESQANRELGKRKWAAFCQNNLNAHPYVFPSNSLKANPHELDIAIEGCLRLGYGAAPSLFKSDIYLLEHENEVGKAREALKGSYQGEIISMKGFKAMINPTLPPS